MLRQKARNSENKGLLLKDSDEESDETELFVKKSPHKEVETVEKQIEEGDTLQAISIRYHCPISELKRLNNIHKENEIYAKRTIKVPARLFTMALVHVSGDSSPNMESKVTKSEVDKELIEEKLRSTLNLQQKLESATDVNSLIFYSNITSKPCDIADDIIEEVCDEEIHLLPNEIKTADPVVSRLTWSGVDADISWIALVICIVIVIFAVPIIYVFYIAEHAQNFHFHKEHNLSSPQPKT